MPKQTPSNPTTCSDSTVPAGSPAVDCPPRNKNKTLAVVWGAEEVYCADPAPLNGTATGIESEVTGSGSVLVREKSVATPSAKGQSSFKLDWKANAINFEKPKDGKMPESLPAAGTLAADGMSAKTPKDLVVKRLPDKAPEAVTFACSSPKTANGDRDYSWTAAFRMGVENATVQLKQTLQIKKAWNGKWASFDAKKDKLAQTWGYLKKSGTVWNYWDTAKSAWKALPRAFSAYTVKNIVFVQSGSEFVGRNDASFKWPEAFGEPTNYEDMKGKWLKNIKDTWGKTFLVKHKECTGTGLCSWDVDIDVNWSDSAGDKLVYAVWAPDWERSNATDWYLSETRLGVAAHECGHLLGAYDEYDKGAIHPDTKLIEADSIMGQNLTSAHPRHLDGFKDEFKKKVTSWIGRTWELEVKKR